MIARNWKAGLLVASGACAAGIVGALLSRSVGAAPPGDPGVAAAPPSPAVLAERTAVLGEMEAGLTAIADRVEPSVVSISVRKTITTSGIAPFFRQFRVNPGPGDDDDMPETRLFDNAPRSFRASGAGSGVIVRSDGWILTNDHVISGADKVTVKLHDGREFTGTVRRDFKSDLAVVKIDASNLMAAEFADSDKVRVGQWAIAFGSPLGMDDSMTLGIVSARNRNNDISDGRERRYYPSLLQTDAPINPGNSGGPLVDSKGRVMGINVAINSPTGFSAGIGFAIPSNSAKYVMEQLISRGKVTRGFLGLAPADLDPERRKTTGVAAGGVFVMSLEAGTPAAVAGLQPGDVIVKVNGTPVRDEIHFRDVIGRTAPGTKIDIAYRRGGTERVTSATLKEAPAELTNPPADPAKPKPVETSGKLGVRLDTLGGEAAKAFKIEGVTSGAVIVEVLPGSPAAEAGLQPGMVIQKANGKEVSKPEDVRTATEGLKSGSKIDLVVRFGKNSILITVEL